MTIDGEFFGDFVLTTYSMTLAEKFSKPLMMLHTKPTKGCHYLFIYLFIYFKFDFFINNTNRLHPLVMSAALNNLFSVAGKVSEEIV